MELRWSLPNFSNVRTRSGFTGRDGNRTVWSRCGHHYDLLSRFDFLRIPLVVVRVPVTPSDELAPRGKTMAVGFGRSYSCPSDGLGRWVVVGRTGDDWF